MKWLHAHRLLVGRRHNIQVRAAPTAIATSIKARGESSSVCRYSPTCPRRHWSSSNALLEASAQADSTVCTVRECRGVAGYVDPLLGLISGQNEVLSCSNLSQSGGVRSCGPCGSHCRLRRMLCVGGTCSVLEEGVIGLIQVLTQLINMTVCYALRWNPLKYKLHPVNTESL